MNSLERRLQLSLGLAITKDIVKLYGGGTIGFDRSPSLGGLRVTIKLPRNEYGIA